MLNRLTASGGKRLTVPAGKRLSVSILPWTPKYLNLGAWFDASDTSSVVLVSGTAVQRWRDKSGKSNDVVQGSSGLRPTYASNTISFVNGDVLTRGAGSGLLNANGQVSVFLVHEVIDPTVSSDPYFNILNNLSSGSEPAYRRPIMYYARAEDSLAGSNGDTFGANFTPSTNTGVRVISFVTDATTDSMFLDGTLSSSFSNSLQTSTTHSSLSIGDISNQDQTIKFNEIILVADGVNEETRQKVEGYLAHKWGLTANLPVAHPYKTTAPTF